MIHGPSLGHPGGFGSVVSQDQRKRKKPSVKNERASLLKNKTMSSQARRYRQRQQHHHRVTLWTQGVML